MSNFSTKKSCFIRRSGLITGPYSPFRLHEMLQAGNLQETDLYSCDKVQWQPVADLFAPPDAKKEKEKEKSIAAVLIPEKDEEEDEEYLLKSSPVREQEKISLPPEDPPVFEEVTEIRHSFFSDSGRVIALLWDFEGIYPELLSVPGRTFGIAAVLNGIVFTVMALVFGSRLSGNDSLFVPLFMSWGMLAALSLLFAAVCKLSFRQDEDRKWMILSAATLMSHGIPGGTALAWGHSLLQMEKPAVILMFFMVCLCTSCTAVQWKHFSEMEEGIPSRWIWLTTPFLNGFAAIIIYFFIKWM